MTHAQWEVVLDVLYFVREKLQQSWTQGAPYVDAEGRASGNLYDIAAWSLDGAIWDACLGFEPRDRWTYRDVPLQIKRMLSCAAGLPLPTDFADLATRRLHKGPLTLAEWNDWPGRTQEEVLGLVDLVLNRAQLLQLLSRKTIF